MQWYGIKPLKFKQQQKVDGRKSAMTKNGSQILL